MGVGGAYDVVKLAPNASGNSGTSGSLGSPKESGALSLYSLSMDEAIVGTDVTFSCALASASKIRAAYRVFADTFIIYLLIRAISSVY